MGDYIDPEYGLASGLISVRYFTREQRLWARVLFEAMDCISGLVTGEAKMDNRRRIQDEAREWIQRDVEEICSFVWICRQTGLDPNWVREVISTPAIRNKWRETRRRIEKECREQIKETMDDGIIGETRPRSTSFEDLDSIGLQSSMNPVQRVPNGLLC